MNTPPGKHCIASNLRRLAAAFLLTLAFAIALMEIMPCIGTLSDLYMAGVLSAYLQCIPLTLLLLGICLLPPCFYGRTRLRAFAAIALALSPFATWEWQCRGSMLLTLYVLASAFACFAVICILMRTLPQNAASLPLPRGTMVLEAILYWLCLGGVVIPFALVCYSLFSLVSDGTLPTFRPLEVWLAASDFTFILPITIALTTSLCGAWTVCECRCLKASLLQ